MTRGLCAAVGALLVVSAPALAGAESSRLPLMPWPAQVEAGEGALAISPTLAWWADGPASPIVERAVERLAGRLALATGVPVRAQRAASRDAATLRLRWASDPRWLTLEADESYQLEVTASAALLQAAGEAGVLRGLATLAQLVVPGGEGFGLATGRIHDHPRFAWRGLMIDTARHFVPMPALLRELDAMEAVKLNVLHLHLSDAEGFRLESRVHPKLHGEGSDGQFYTQAEVRQLVADAADRGIRVVPELDMPAHTCSWLVGYPQLGSRPGPFRLGFDPAAAGAALDPSRDEVYAFVDALVGEMTGLFPDRFFHMGGDEVVGDEWQQNPKIRAFMEANGIVDRRALQAHFSRRVSAILAKHGRTTMGWDEVLGDGLLQDAVLQSWRSSKMTARATAAGHRVVVSAGYYLDWLMPAVYHYALDPADPRGVGISEQEVKALASTPFAAYLGEERVMDQAASLSAAQEALVLGAEAALWTEMVSPEMVDGRLWPRTAAIAERFWSSKETRDPESMLRRMVGVSRQLEALSLRHEEDRRLMLARLAPGAEASALALGDAVAPSRYYSRLLRRAMAGPAAMAVPMNRLADAATPDSAQGLRFAQDVRDLIAARERSGPRLLRVRRQLVAWRDVSPALAVSAERQPLLREALPVAADLATLADAGLRALDAWERGTPLAAESLGGALALAEQHAKAAESTSTSLVESLQPPPPAEVVLTAAPPIRDLLREASGR
ncbi:MAG TPA: family 20 glycosylhydrolase [Vicinamibacteria bacterium]|nr:family 20 glycosylhydrolase [Vicinamibacteria bacterium]